MEPYRFSFVGAHAMIPDFIKLGKLVHDGANISDLDASFLGIEKKETYRRKFRELKHRIKNLTSPQIELLAEGTHDQQLHITHLALCKTYHIYRDFVTEVLAEKVQLFDYSITDLDYNSFISRKNVDHPELDALAHTTQKRVKQVLYKMLYQVELTDSTKNPTLQIPILDEKTEQAIIQDDPKLLSCFLYDQNRIESTL